MAELAELAEIAECEVLRRAIWRGVEPRLVVFYRRTAMRCESGRVRVTIDEDLEFCRRQDIARATSLGRPELAVGGAGPLLEVKWTGDKPQWLEKLVGGLDPADHGKYERGMVALRKQITYPRKRLPSVGVA